MAIASLPLAAGDRPLAAGDRPLAAGDRPLAAGDRPLAAGDRPPAAEDLRVSAPPRDPLPEAGATSAEGRAETRGDRRKTVGVFKFHMDS
jgi:hypothetical protein